MRTESSESLFWALYEVKVDCLQDKISHIFIPIVSDFHGRGNGSQFTNRLRMRVVALFVDVRLHRSFSSLFRW